METKLKELATPYKFRFVEEAKVVEEMVVAEYEKVKGFIEAPGFRKGNVPRKIAEKQPNFDRFRVYRGVFDELYKNAIKKEGLEIVDAQNFEVMGPFEDNTPLAIQTTVYLMPKVKSFDINNVNVESKKTIVTDELVDEQIKLLQNKHALFTNVTDKEYAIKQGDVLIIDFTGKVNGKEFKGGAAKSYRYVVGETNFIPGFAEQLVLLKLNETSNVKVKFPDDYYESELRNKDAEFSVTINKIESKSAKTTEQLAQDQQLTLDAFVKSVKDKLIEDHKQIDEETFQSDVLTACIQAAKIDPIPESMVKWELDNEWHQLLYRMSMTEETYLKKFPKAKDSFYAQKTIRIEKAIEVKIFLSYICEDVKITATKEEVINFVMNRASTLQKSDEDRKSILANLEKEQNYRASEMTVKNDKAVTYLVDVVKSRNAKA
ncbi:MAG: trigger factor [Nitrosarchaeum sp.]|nr:trigger factor [Nitrosarchaeum sp.]